jgi:hypothetical protein
MRIIEISALDNGAHRNQNGGLSVVPEGWAVIPDDMPVPETFPFVNITVKDGVVTSMTAGTMPEPEPVPEPAPTQLDMIEAQVTYTAMMTDTLLGV